MSANLLRRAARTLRQRVQGLPVDWKERWEVITTDSESLSGVAPEHPGHTGDTHWPCDRCEHFETYREGLAAYVRLLDPLVADALAAWLDDAAKDAEARVVAELHVGMQPGDLVSPREELAVRLARAICRTRPEGPVSTSPETGPGAEDFAETIAYHDEQIRAAGLVEFPDPNWTALRAGSTKDGTE